MDAMARFTDDPSARADIQHLGDALAALRRSAGFSQAEAGSRAGMTSQGWGFYEMGRRPGLFRPDVQRRMTAALGATPEALGLEYARLVMAAERDAPTAAGLESRGRGFAGAAALDRWCVPDDALTPWAERGIVLVLADRAPRVGQGCLIERADGGRLVGLFVCRDAAGLDLKHPVTGLTTRVDSADVRDVRVVTARLEGES
jgi:transcriptional regulator with XRE-family HTH domain